MTTAIETEIHTWFMPSEEPVPRCVVIWWKPVDVNGEQVIDHQCNRPATHTVTTHDGANLVGIPHPIRSDVICSQCLDDLTMLWCEIHNCSVVISSGKL